MTEENQAAPQAPAFSMQDLENAVKIIDAAAARGAFRGEELSSVGAVRDKLSSFLKAAVANAAGAEASVEQEADVAPPEKKAGRKR